MLHCTLIRDNGRQRRRTVRKWQLRRFQRNMSGVGVLCLFCLLSTSLLFYNNNFIRTQAYDFHKKIIFSEQSSRVQKKKTKLRIVSLESLYVRTSLPAYHTKTTALARFLFANADLNIGGLKSWNFWYYTFINDNKWLYIFRMCVDFLFIYSTLFLS